MSSDQKIWEDFVGELKKNGVLIERIIKSFYRRLLQRESICIDVGAHVGYHTLGLAEKVLDGTVVACEASPSTYLKLLKSISEHRSQLGKILTINAAIQSDESKRNVTFNYSEEHPGRSGLQKSWDGLDYLECTVTSQTVDSIVYGVNLSRVDFIKIDVEGSEFDVLQGGEKVLLNFRPVVVVEHSVLFNKNFFNKCRCFFERVRYKAFFPNGIPVELNNFNDYWYVFLFPEERVENSLSLLESTFKDFELHVY